MVMEGGGLLGAAGVCGAVGVCLLGDDDGNPALIFVESKK
jgi:hypothetical protein